MRHIIFIGAWIGTGASEDFQRCAAADLWNASGIEIGMLRDLGQTNVIPSPNICAFEAWVSAAGVALLEANPNDYQVLVDEAA